MLDSFSALPFLERRAHLEDLERFRQERTDLHLVDGEGRYRPNVGLLVHALPLGGLNDLRDLTPMLQEPLARSARLLGGEGRVVPNADGCCATYTDEETKNHVQWLRCGGVELLASPVDAAPHYGSGLRTLQPQHRRAVLLEDLPASLRLLWALIPPNSGLAISALLSNTTEVRFGSSRTGIGRPELRTPWVVSSTESDVADRARAIADAIWQAMGRPDSRE